MCERQVGDRISAKVVHLEESKRRRYSVTTGADKIKERRDGKREERNGGDDDDDGESCDD